jgi:hypothetical protein
MTDVGLSKLEQPEFTASTRPGSPALIVIAEHRIPQEARDLGHIKGLILATLKMRFFDLKGYLGDVTHATDLSADSIHHSPKLTSFTKTETGR